MMDLDNKIIGTEINGYIVNDMYYDKYGHKIYLLKCLMCGKLAEKRSLNKNIRKCNCQYDLTNKQIGFLHINYLKKDHKRKDQRIWNCTCICNKKVDFLEASILKNYGVPKSCGCINNRNNLIGKTFGLLTVIEYCGRKNNSLLWKCKCECGRLVFKTSNQLYNNKVYNLGCDVCIHNVEFKLKNNYYECYIKNTSIIFLIDVDDFDKVAGHNWCQSDNGYIKTSKNNKLIYLHRIIMDVFDKKQLVDHINHNILDNRKSNLRIVTHSQNSMNCINQINYMNGIRKCGKSSWTAIIYINNESINLGTYNNIDDAIKARKEAEEKYFGEYSYKNSMQKGKTTIE